jgi:type IV pilus assembly protein PilA
MNRIELLIVVAIILIIAAIAIPNLLKSKMAANQASAVASLRTINTSQVTYSSTYDQGFTSTLVQLGPPASGNATSAAAGLVDSVLAAGTKSGYSFTYTASAAVNGSTPGYTITAVPVSVGSTGQNYYFTDESNVIRQNTSATASASDSPIGG